WATGGVARPGWGAAGGRWGAIAGRPGWGAAGIRPGWRGGWAGYRPGWGYRRGWGFRGPWYGAEGLGLASAAYYNSYYPYDYGYGYGGYGYDDCAPIRQRVFDGYAY